MRSLALGVFLAVNAALAAGCARGAKAGPIVASGHVEAREVRLAAKYGGRVATLSVEEGDLVTAGQELARLETTEARLALEQAQAERRQADADLRLRLAGARREDRAELAAQVEALRVDLGAAERDQQRMEALLERGSGTAKARDDARARRDALAARLEALRQSQARMEAGSRPEEIEAARARVAAAQARAGQLEERLKDAVVTAPRAGLVTEKVAEAGEMVSAGAPLVVVTDLQDAWLNVYVSEPDLARIRLGQPAEVHTDDGQVRSGRVAFVASQAEFTPRNVQTRDERAKLVFKVKVALDNAGGIFKPGMPAEARLAPAGAGQ
jgi:HlyD family secretion protein